MIGAMQSDPLDVWANPLFEGTGSVVVQWLAPAVPEASINEQCWVRDPSPQKSSTQVSNES